MLDEITFITTMHSGNYDPDNQAQKNIDERVEYVARMLCYFGFSVTSHAIEYGDEQVKIIIRARQARWDGSANFYKPKILTTGNGKTYLDITGLTPQ